jgi:serine/threonine protein kinase
MANQDNWQNQTPKSQRTKIAEDPVILRPAGLDTLKETTTSPSATGTGDTMRESQEQGLALLAAAPVSPQKPKLWKQAGAALLYQYTVERILGTGGMGEVYLATSRSDGKQHAVKIATLPGVERIYFLEELLVWIHISQNPHPNLVTCHFFQTIEDRVAIFAEYVPGESLHDAIRAGKLTDSQKILDVAIQMAWGLEALHSLGFIHQDIKPKNILLHQDGTVKTCDFGIARARACVDEARTGSLSGETGYVTGALGTPGYRSPEQMAGKVSRKSDQWSYAASLLEIYTQGVTWRDGEADETLDGLVPKRAMPDLLAWIQRKFANILGLLPKRDVIPAPLARVLRKCLARNTEERWPSMVHVAQELIACYKAITGQAYPRPATAWELKEILSTPAPRRTLAGGTWSPPQVWPREAATAVTKYQRDHPADRLPKWLDKVIAAAAKPDEPRGTFVEQALSDMIGYEWAGAAFEWLREKGQSDWETRLATLWEVETFIYEYAGDIPGASALYDKARAIYERLVAQGRRELLGDLATSRLYLADVYLKTGKQVEAEKIAREEIVVLEAEVTRTGRADLRQVLAWAKKVLQNLL